MVGRATPRPRSTPTPTYSVATNDFMRKGGDGYAVLRDEATHAYDFGPGLDEVLIDFLVANPDYKPGSTGASSGATDRGGQRQTWLPERIAAAVPGAATPGTERSGGRSSLRQQACCQARPSVRPASASDQISPRLRRLHGAKAPPRARISLRRARRRRGVPMQLWRRARSSCNASPPCPAEGNRRGERRDQYPALMPRLPTCRRDLARPAFGNPPRGFHDLRAADSSPDVRPIHDHLALRGHGDAL